MTCPGSQVGAVAAATEDKAFNKISRFHGKAQNTQRRRDLANQ